jgi:hypothetical protein
MSAPETYEDGDQRNIPQSEIEQQKKNYRFHEGKENSHKANDSSEQTLPDKERFHADYAGKRTSEVLLIGWLGKRRCILTKRWKIFADVL